MKMLMAALAALLIHCLCAGIAFAGAPYPEGPAPNLTPGELCKPIEAIEIRYSERINYCGREVTTELKGFVIQSYDRNLGYSIMSMDRQMFKIDHYIPLCMGGSNSPANLWPQHLSKSAVTDNLEKLLCKQMERGRLKQADAVKLIKQGKNNLNQVPQIMRYAGSL